MVTQSEAILEKNLIGQLALGGYEKVTIRNEDELKANLKIQLERHNETTLTDLEFREILNHLSKGSIFEKAKTLRDQYVIKREGQPDKYISFLDSVDWCQNLFQVTNQVTIEGRYKNRYDVTILINGLPLCQIELKRRGIELKEAFNQIQRYQKHSFGYGSQLFQYVQLFVISNGVNTKYYANNKKKDFIFTSFWADEENKKITNLDEFTEVFLEKCHLSKMICRYIVLAEATKSLMVLRPYQYHATEKIIRRVESSDKNGYIWHTTGSGKTLTSFKTSQLLRSNPKIDKVVFVVDRNDLDYQTRKEFDSFSKGCVDSSEKTSTAKIVDNLIDPENKLVVTTIQKLNNAISKNQYKEKMKPLIESKIVFIFDECHRSQFGETHKKICDYFKNNQMIGFTGTPIFADNSVKNQLGKRTTKDLFDECLHNYVITDAITDENVLKFSIEYIGRYKKKESATNLDIDVQAIDTKEALEADDRLHKITDFIISQHDAKTKNKKFTAMMCVSSVDMLIKYYEIFKGKKEKGEHDLKIATIFSYGANEEDKGATGEEKLDGNDDTEDYSPHSREKLEEFVADYNKMFGEAQSIKDTQGFYKYYHDISKKVKEKKIDILLVVNMFLTGFDSKTLNTLYVDKNLKFHGLIQAFSRTNRIFKLKTHGNIICFRNLKENTDGAIALFSNKQPKETILVESYEEYLKKFQEALLKLKKITPSVDSVNDLEDEDKILEFVRSFRELLRLKNAMEGFSDFDFSDFGISEQELADYTSKYFDIKDSITIKATEPDKVSILNDIDFELELLHKDEVNVSYILKLLANLGYGDEGEKKKKRQQISNIINNTPELRSKRELIEKFIDENLLKINKIDDVQDEFENFMDKEKAKEYKKICEEESLNPEKLKAVIETYIYDQRKPLNDDIAGVLTFTPKLLERAKIVPRILEKIVSFVEKFYGE